MKFSSYPTITAITDADTFLIHQDGSNAEKQVAASDLYLYVGGAQSVDSIADLKALDVTTISDGKQVSVAGYYTPADGGGGMFVWESGSVATPNGGTVVAPNAGTGNWLRIVSDVLNVKHFGAKGDGVTNDTTAISAAIAAAGSGMSVLFPASPNPYIITTPITLAVSQVTLLGYGARISGVNAGQYRKFIINNLTNITILGLTFNGLYLGGGTGLGSGVIEITDSKDIAVRDCYFANVPQSSVYILGDSRRVQIRGNTFYNNFCAIFSDDDTFNQPIGLVIDGNEFRDGTSAAAKAAYSGAIKISGMGTSNSLVGHVIANNRISSPGQMGIELQTHINNSAVTGNHVQDAATGISIDNSATVSVTGNTVKACTGYGIEVTSTSSQCTIAGNTVSGLDDSGTAVGSDCIIVNGSTGIVVSGNATLGGTGSDIHVQSCNTVTISGNEIRPDSGSGLNIQTSYLVNISGNLIVSSTANVHTGIIFDFTGGGGTSKGFVVANNTFKGTFDYNIIRFYASSGSEVIQGVDISGNDTTSAGTGGNPAFGTTFAGSTAVLRNLMFDRNIGTTSDNTSINLLGPVVNINYDVANPTYLGAKVYNVDASGGARSYELPAAGKAYGQVVTVKKSDVSGNAVTVTVDGGGTIDGGGSVILAAQYDSVTVVDNGTEYNILAQV